MKKRTKAFAVATVMTAAMLAGGCSKSPEVTATIHDELTIKK